MVVKHFRRLKNRLASAIRKVFKKKKEIKIGLYGPVNSGKTTLANRICVDWLGEELGKVTSIPHETREIQMKEKVTIKDNGRSLTFNLVDTPGIATKIDFEDFLKFGMKRKEAKERAKEATRGVIESIKWLDKMDMVLVVLDSTRSPINQVNITILGNLDARNIPLLIVSNKVDLKSSSTSRVRTAFPGYDVIGISAKTGAMVNELYKMVLKKI
ncbi:MAG: GTP-binding protein [Candidatus Aenigmarchaeota archaeon]|nr:GTP-binding protein [Candidatus Aenigmarchaeota archaeon]NIQ17525.1 GTP-binding protein [Candidatus Aenigmarchaeota archaeon]NIS73103.1 GTP-binding protein [Candidatus Aenigmarchaeota archaeon]